MTLCSAVARRPLWQKHIVQVECTRWGWAGWATGRVLSYRSVRLIWKHRHTGSLALYSTKLKFLNSFCGLLNMDRLVACFPEVRSFIAPSDFMKSTDYNISMLIFWRNLFGDQICLRAILVFFFEWISVVQWTGNEESKVWPIYEQKKLLHNNIDVANERTLSLLNGKYLTCECESHLVLSDSVWPHGIYSPWNSPGQNTGVGSLSLSPGDLSNPGIKPRSPTLQVDSLPGEPPGKPKYLTYDFCFGIRGAKIM